jgi:RimJ/RimL family protein N-acetyltransferase
MAIDKTLITTVTPGGVPRPSVAVPARDWRHALPVLTGERSCLRELEPEDAATLLPLLSAPEVARFISPPPHSLEQFAWFIETSRTERAAGRYAGFALVPHGHEAAVGVVQLRQTERGFVTAEWGFAMSSRWWGSGLFLEASRLLIDFAFGTVGVHRLEARAAVANGRCQAAMQKLGAVREGVLRQSLTAADGTRLDQVLWSILAADWRELLATTSVRVH